MAAHVENREAGLVVDEPRDGQPLLLPQAELVPPHDLVVRQRILALEQVPEVDRLQQRRHLLPRQVLAAAGVRV